MPSPEAPLPTFSSSLSPSLMGELRGLGRMVSTPAGGSVMHQDAPGDCVLLLCEGHVKVVRLGRGGTQALLDFRGPGELVGELAVLDAGTRSATVQAVTDVRAHAFAASDFKAFLSRHFDVALQLMSMLAHRLRDADHQRLQIGTDYTVDRVAARLVELAGRFGTAQADGAVVVGLPVSQEELAAWCGASREATVKALRQLRALGLIETGRHRLVVLDVQRLMQRLA